MSIGERSLTAPRVMLVVYIVLLFAIPAPLIVGPLGAAGTPAQIVAIALFLWWLASVLTGRRSLRGANPIKWLLLAFVLALLASYVAGMIRPIAYVAETNSADRALLSLAAWCGIVLVMSDGLDTLPRLESILKVIAGGVTAVAALGIVQFELKLDLAQYLSVPGLTQNDEYGELVARSKFYRVAATASHPIEFGVVLSAVLPLLIHFAQFADTPAQRRRWWIATGIVAVALPMSVARSAALGGVVVFLVLVFTWPVRLRMRILTATIVGALAMSVVVPGLLGTIRNLFLQANSDSSTQARTADYGPAESYISEHLLFGRGLGTFLPTIYRTFDNAYLGVAVQSGIIGLLAFLALLVGTMVTARRIRRDSADASVRDLAQCFVAGVAVVLVNAATFDALNFPMCAGVSFLIMGATSALWSIQRADRVNPVRANSPTRESAIIWLRVATAVSIVGLLIASYYVATAKPSFEARVTTALVDPQAPSQLSVLPSGQETYAGSTLLQVMTSDVIRTQLRREGAADYEVAFDEGSLAAGTDQVGNPSSTLHIATTGTDAANTDAMMATVLRTMSAQLAAMQNAAKVPASLQLRIQVVDQQPALSISGEPMRAWAGFGVLSLLILGTLYQIRRMQRRPRHESKPLTTSARKPELVGSAASS